MIRAPSPLQRFVDVVRHRLGLEPHASQLRAAEKLQSRCIVEMQTGEGKTLTAALGASLRAAKGGRVYIATANDYLAARDALDMQPLYEGIGLRTGAITSGLDRETRINIYRSDIVYGTIRELGFDLLRDAIDARSQLRLQTASNSNHHHSAVVPTFHCLLVDEADSVLIDEARTPLVISDHGASLAPDSNALFKWAAQQAESFRRGEDYVIHEATGAIALCEQGIAKIIHREMPPAMNRIPMTTILHSVERAIDVATRVTRDVHYMVHEDQVVLVDEYTGRAASGKKMGDGVHQAIEAKERVPLTAPSRPVARMAIQELVNQFPNVCGLTATAMEDAGEFRSVYDLKAIRVPPHVPSRRTSLLTHVFFNQPAKHNRIVAETKAVIQAGRAVLIGTRTIRQSEAISHLLAQHQVAHVVLNARQSHEEASIIAMAGQRGRVTVATNMAGRGTDIRLADDVLTAGGLHVIISEPHAAARIDRQLAGRCGRQGDPGTVRLFLASDDDVFRLAYGDQKAESIASWPNNRMAEARLRLQVKHAQRSIRQLHRRQRYQLSISEAQIAADMRQIGLDPHLDRVSHDFF